MIYFIDKITNKNGITRLDGRYPSRIGSIVNMMTQPLIGYPLFFRYVKFRNGQKVEDHITKTSLIEKSENIPGFLIVHTENSVYHFKELNPDETRNFTCEDFVKEDTELEEIFNALSQMLHPNARSSSLHKGEEL